MKLRKVGVVAFVLRTRGGFGNWTELVIAVCLLAQTVGVSAVIKIYLVNPAVEVVSGCILPLINAELLTVQR